MRRIPLLSVAVLAAIAVSATSAGADPDTARKAPPSGPAAPETVPETAPDAAPNAAPSPGGTLTVQNATVRAGQPVAFTYSTPAPGPTNWIGIYTDPGDGPVDRRFVGPSLKWVYIPKASGTATLPTEGLQPGDYIAFALAEDGYEWLAQPVRFRITDGGALRFAAERIPLRNAQAGRPYAATVRGLVRGDLDGLTFEKVSGPGWVRVAADGAVTGTPPPGESSKTTVAEVRVANKAGESRTARLEVGVRPPGARLVPTLKALSWNLWHGGSQVSGGREKQVRFLLDHDVDVVGVQEGSNESVRELGEALGWDYYQAGDVGVLSRYPIVARGPLPSQSHLPVSNVRIRLDERRRTEVAVWNVHLGYTPYGPYDACFGKMTVEQLLAREAESRRTAQIEGVMRAMRADLDAADRTPVLLTGDFNAPSHLDWTKRDSRCGYGDVPWPTSVLPARAGLKDTFRVANPDPAAAPGITWSPIYKTFTGGYGHDAHKGEPEPQDRIDFVYAKGASLTVKSSAALVEGKPAPVPDHRDNQWTSDHAAVLTEFIVK
ncbi:endonuclease/exonuclease/phosphatase family protein [Sinosporangium siamense]|uniref:Endonuclease/exonuclease/phosphatase domain-containing protein n=1 Tax=Sinosporangium siamense TaxID=1367973 RepID=A0A919RDX6_9ACTN|nr:endonuclease/exonuclease/phosphatase family protein [Sinosporangium siamense]GII91838.1 hypothetical protein Ssi02_20690 [Sinosporangium siamense]